MSRAMTPEQEAEFNRLVAAVNELQAVVRKLGAAQGLVWSVDASDWANIEKLKEFAKNPR